MPINDSNTPTHNSNIDQPSNDLTFNLKRLEANLEVNTELVKRLDRLLKALKDPQLESPSKYLGDIDLCLEISQTADNNDNSQSRSLLSSVAPPYNDMIENIVEQSMSQAAGEEEQDLKKQETLFVWLLEGHFERLEGLKRADIEEYKQLKGESCEREMDTSEEKAEPVDTTKTMKANKSITLNTPKSDGDNNATLFESSESVQPSNASLESDQQAHTLAQTPDKDTLSTPHTTTQISPATLQFGSIPIGHYITARDFLTTHPWMLTDPNQHDQLLIEAFEMELGQNSEAMKRLVHNALLLQYCVQISMSTTASGGGDQHDDDKMGLFFKRLGDTTHPAYKAFMKQVEWMTDRISLQCKDGLKGELE